MEPKPRTLLSQASRFFLLARTSQPTSVIPPSPWTRRNALTLHIAVGRLSFLFFFASRRRIFSSCFSAAPSRFVTKIRGHITCRLDPLAAFAMCISILWFVTTELVSLYEAIARTLVVLDVDGWKYQFIVQNTHSRPSYFTQSTQL